MFSGVGLATVPVQPLFDVGRAEPQPVQYRRLHAAGLDRLGAHAMIGARRKSAMSPSFVWAIARPIAMIKATGPSILQRWSLSFSLRGYTFSFASTFAETLPIIQVIIEFPSCQSVRESVRASTSFIGSLMFL